jgi:uncharacterized protein YraI
MRPKLLIALTLALFATPAFAAPTAKVVGGDIQVRTGPGSNYASLGVLPNGSEVTLDRCTRSGRWCLVVGNGWVEASYLVGWAAKIRATPSKFLGDGFASHGGLFND